MGPWNCCRKASQSPKYASECADDRNGEYGLWFWLWLLPPPPPPPPPPALTAEGDATDEDDEDDEELAG